MDNEVKGGVGNHLSFGDFGYDTRVARRFNLDPIDQIFISNYAGFGNNPIFYSDPTGFAKEIINGKERYLHDETVKEADKVTPVAPEGLDDYTQGKIPAIKERSPLENFAHNLGIPVGRNVPSSMDGAQEMLLAPLPFVGSMKDFSDGYQSDNKYLMGVGIIGLGLDAIPGERLAKYGLSLVGKEALKSLPIMTYRASRALTKGYKGTIQAHHIVEVRHLKKLGLSIQDAPAIILSSDEHLKITNALYEALPKKLVSGAEVNYTKTQILKAYNEVYKDYPELYKAAEKFLFGN